MKLTDWATLSQSNNHKINWLSHSVSVSFIATKLTDWATQSQSNNHNDVQSWKILQWEQECKSRKDENNSNDDKKCLWPHAADDWPFAAGAGSAPGAPIEGCPAKTHSKTGTFTLSIDSDTEIVFNNNKIAEVK